MSSGGVDVGDLSAPAPCRKSPDFRIGGLLWSFPSLRSWLVFQGSTFSLNGLPLKVRGSVFQPYCVHVQSLSRVQVSATPWTVAHQAPLSMGFSRQEYWSGLPCPPPEDLPSSGFEPTSPALAGRLYH